MTTIELDAGAFAREYEKRLVVGIRKAIPVLLEELKRLTPEDTRNMLESYVVEDVKVEGDKVIGSIRNDADYAIYVEYGINGISYNYHKPKGTVFYQGVGNRTFARAVDNVRERVENIILSEVNR